MEASGPSPEGWGSGKLARLTRRFLVPGVATLEVVVAVSPLRCGCSVVGRALSHEDGDGNGGRETGRGPAPSSDSTKNVGSGHERRGSEMPMTAVMEQV